jgi:alcohol dehydrogenase (cytochrome c)
MQTTCRARAFLAVPVLLAAGALGGIFAPSPTAIAQAPPPSDFVPVTDAMLQSPAPEDWLMWRRTLDGWGFRCRGFVTH